MSGLPITVNARQRCIIYALLNAQGRMTLEKISKETGLAPRVIRYNLDIVRAWFRNENVTLSSRPGYGIDIDAPKALRKRLLQTLSQQGESDLLLTHDQRQRITLFELLNTDTPITYQNLAVNEGISRSTIIHDVNDVQKWLDAYHLVLKRTPNRGVVILGDELSRRYALLNLIHEELGERKWYSLWFKPNLDLILDKSIPPNLENYLKSLPFEYCHTLTQHIENVIGGRLALYSRVEILVYLAVTVNAIRKGKFHANYDALSDFDSPFEMQISNFVFSEINRKYTIPIPAVESRMLAVCLLSSKWEEDDLAVSNNASDDIEQLGQDTIEYANDIVRLCSTQLHPLLRVDQELSISLARHLKPVIQRIRYDLPIVNGNLEDMQRLYPEVYRSAKSGLIAIERDLGKPVPPEEVGFIAMYLVAALNRLRTIDRLKHSVVIISDGIRAKTAFLRARIELEFPTMEIVGVISGYPTDETMLSQAELVLSLIPTDVPGVTTMVVSPFLTASEKRAIQNWLLEKEEKEHTLIIQPSKKPDLVDLLRPQHIVFSKKPRDWREFVEKASQPLIESGLIKHQYCASMIHIIEEYGPYMILADGTILLHARPVDGVNSLCLSCLVAEEGVSFSKDSGVVDIAFVLGATDDQSHLNALYQLSELLEKEGFTAELRKSKKPADVLRAIWSKSTP